MGLFDLFKRSEPLLSIDIGSSGIKIVEIDSTRSKPTLVNMVKAPLSTDVFANNTIVKIDDVASKIEALLEANDFSEYRVVTAMPGPSVFTKKLKMAKMAPAELANNVQFEAQNAIPHSIDAVRMDYHIIGEAGRNHLEVLVVAVKNEIVESFLQCLGQAGLEVAVVDVDYFALQNCFEMNYPELVPKTVALIDVGSRFSSINICKNGVSLFTGDIAVGGKLFTDALIEGLGVSVEKAEEYKRDNDVRSEHYEEVSDIIDRKVEFVSQELNRQLSLFWNAAGAEDEGIETIMLAGGGALVPNLVEELSERTGIDVKRLDPLKELDRDGDFDDRYLDELAPHLSVGIGMGLRQPGDRISPDYEV